MVFAKPFFRPRNAIPSERSVKIAFSSNVLNGSSKNVALNLDDLKTFGLRSLSVIRSGFEVSGRDGYSRQDWASAAPKDAERYFIERYLGPILRCFSRADIIGEGGKAHARLAKTGVRWTRIGALAPPGCNQRRVREGPNTCCSEISERNGSLANVYNEKMFADRPMYRRRIVPVSRKRAPRIRLSRSIAPA